MARYLEIHPQDPQPRLLGQVVDVLRRGGLIAYPTDSGYALGCALGTKEGLDRIRAIRRLDDRHHFTLLCRDFAQLGPLVIVDNTTFRLLKSVTPGPYTFILRATKEVPRMMLNPRKHTVGARIPDHRLSQALLTALGEPLVTSTLILPGAEEPMVNGWEVREELDHAVDVIVESESGESGPTTVVDLTSGTPEVVRVGAGDPDRF